MRNDKNNDAENATIGEVTTDVIKDVEAHPIATGVGMLSGAVAGAALGMMGGPIGILVGAITGAAVGTVAGPAGEKLINSEAEDEYWRNSFRSTAYYNSDFEYDRDYRAAYAVGYALRQSYPSGATFEDAEEYLKERWEDVKGESKLNWLAAREAVKDAWNHAS